MEVPENGAEDDVTAPEADSGRDDAVESVPAADPDDDDVDPPGVGHAVRVGSNSR